MNETKKDKVAEIVTRRIVEALEEIIKTGEGSVPWQKPWKTTYLGDGTTCYGAMNAISCKPYRGINQIILGFFHGYEDKLWYLSRKQILNLGFRIKSEEYKNDIPILFWGKKKIEEDVEDKNGNVKTQKKFFWFKRFYSVYHFSQIDAPIEDILAKLPLAKKVKAAEEAKKSGKAPVFDCIKAAEDVVANMPKKPAISENGGDRAYYVPSSDSIHMPKRENFISNSSFYSTLFHEIVHSTGHESRLGRKSLMEFNGFGSHEYSKEELVAEIGANMILSTIQIDTKTENQNTIAYCKSWLAKLRDDVNFVIDAAAKAQKAVDFILDTAPVYDNE